ncbi:MAG: T9SS type A sorting domain-containing protein [Bacteroidales bacterium]|jgi:exonuclease III|nr:T9SS type A sorting domain-containing protein [Bacteroidales bacterium]
MPLNTPCFYSKLQTSTVLKTTTFLLFFFSFFTKEALYATDTLRMMQYNLMYYATSAPDGCNVSEESYLNNKDFNLRTIVQYVQPDVLCVNELGTSQTLVNRILNNVMNYNGINWYASCPLTHLSYSSMIGNMLYYNTKKLAFHSHFTVITNIRDINAYRLYYKSSSLAQGDTVFITFIIAHLKAGSGTSNEAQRAYETQQLMSRLELIGKADNYVFSGDFNITNSSEQCYQNLINPANTLFTFYDPLDANGHWNNNSSFAYLHTQSTHTSAYSGECYGTGGMDDRFDFILTSSYLKWGLRGAQALSSTYHALGQDGNRFNGSINIPENNSIPSDVGYALYFCSDHIPVIMDFKIDANPAIVQSITEDAELYIVNPVQDDLLQIHCYTKVPQQLEFAIYAIDGRLLDRFTQGINVGETVIDRALPYPSALYFLSVKDEHNRTITKKIIK